MLFLTFLHPFHFGGELSCLSLFPISWFKKNELFIHVLALLSTNLLTEVIVF